MDSLAQALFERYAQQRLCLDPPDDYGTRRQTLVRLRAYLMTLVESTCLNQVAVRLISRIEMYAAQEGRLVELESLPQTPIWLMLEEPIRLPAIMVEGEMRQDGEEVVAAFFFRAPWSSAILERVRLPPVPGLPQPTAAQAARSWEWRLDLIDPLGESLAEYYLDARSGRWRVLETSECPWRRLDPELGYETIQACKECQQRMEALTHLFSILLMCDLGRPLTLTNVVWQRFTHAATVRERFDASL